jgi:hypothetical protein
MRTAAALAGGRAWRRDRSRAGLRGVVPDVWMLIGCSVIVGSGLFVFYREAVLGQR